MSFIPTVLTKEDTFNTRVIVGATGFTGTSTETTGYNTIILTIESTANSTACGVKIQFSSDMFTGFETFYSDTSFGNTIFNKTYTILKKYYRVIYTQETSSDIKITSRLSVQLNSNTNTNNSITVFDNSVENTIDAFGKLRVSMPYTLLDLRIPGQDAGNGITGATGYLNNDMMICSGYTGSIGATGWKVSNNSKCTIGVSGQATFINQSKKYCVYQPGKSLLYMSSAVIHANHSVGASGFYNRLGYFDDRDGLFFQYYLNGTENGVMSIVIRNDIDEVIEQKDWNIDKMDGSGPSKLTLDFTKTQLFVIDMEWLGVGRVRFGFYAFGRIQYCHQVTNINILTKPYTNSINLPIRFEVHGYTGGTGYSTMEQICATVMSEGGYNPVGRPFNAISGESTTSVLTTETPILALRGGGNNFYHQNIYVTGYGVILTSTDYVIYKLRYFPAGTFTSPSAWIDVNSNYSVAQYLSGVAIGISEFNSALSSSIIIDEGFIYGKGTNSFSNNNRVFTNETQITSNVNNVSDVIILTLQAVNTGSNANAYASISWQEGY